LLRRWLVLFKAFFFFERPKRVWQFNKELAQHANRLSQYLAVIFPTKNYCDLDRKKFLKALDGIE
jgi:hypothetical protein